MRWSTLFCIFSMLSVVSANINDTNASSTEPSPTSSDDVRPKRHLSTLLNIKKTIIGKVFGSSAPSESYKLYRIPGHENILVKAVPIKPTENYDEKPTEVPTNPTITLLESYLGTKTPNETLKALDGVKNLLGSGIITNDALLNRLLVPVEPPKITYRVPQVSQLYPSVLHVPWVTEPQQFLVKTPEKPCADKVAPTPVIVEKPVRVIPEAPILPHLSFLPEVQVPPRPVVVKELPVPVKEFLDVPRVEIPDYRPVQVSTIPSNPYVQKGYEYLYKVPVFGKPQYYPGAFSYPQFTVTQDSKPVRPAVLTPPIVEKVQVITEKVVQNEPTYVKVPSTGFSYHHIKNGEYVTNFGNNGEIPTIVNVIPEAPKLPGFLVPVVKIPNNPATYGPVQVEKIPKNPSGFSYHQFHGDGSVTLFGDGSIPLARPAVLPSLVADRINVISEQVMDSKPEVFVGKPEIKPNYSYHQIKNDGSVITYSGDGKKTDNRYVQVIPESSRRPSLHVSDVFVTEINTPEFGPVKVQKIPKNPSGFSYHQVNTDGSETIYKGGDVIPPVVRETSKYSTLFLNRPVSSDTRHPSFGPIIHVGKIPEHPEYSYQQLYTGGLASTYTGSNGPIPNERVHNNGGYSYQQVYKDGSATTYTGSDVVTPVTRPAELHHIVADRIQEITEKFTPAKHEHSGYSYHLVGDQDTVTTFVGENGKRPSFPEPPRLSTTLNHPDVPSTHPDSRPVVHVDKIPKVPSVTIISDNDGKTPIPEPPKLSTLLNHQEVILTEVKTPQQVVSGNSGYSYQQSNGDGSVTTFTGSEMVHQDTATTVQVPVPEHTEPQTSSVQHDKEQLVIIGSAIGQGGQQYVSVFDVPNTYIKPIDVEELPKNPSSGFSYQQINDGSVTTYTGDDIKVKPDISSLSNNGIALGSSKKPCPETTKCVVETKVSFPSPVVSTYEYQQLVRSNPNKKFTVVNIEDGQLRHQEASVTVTAAPVGHVSRRPAYRRRTRPTSTEGPLAANPIVVPEEAGYIYKQTNSDGSTTKIEGSDQHVTVSVSGEVRKTVHRGDIPE